MMSNRMKQSLDRHITGNWGEDQFEPRLIQGDEALEAAEMSLEDAVMGYECPPCCSTCAYEGVMVEPDGNCQHGFPSALISLGLI